MVWLHLIWRTRLHTHKRIHPVSSDQRRSGLPSSLKQLQAKPLGIRKLLFLGSCTWIWKIYANFRVKIWDIVKDPIAWDEVNDTDFWCAIISTLCCSRLYTIAYHTFHMWMCAYHLFRLKLSAIGSTAHENSSDRRFRVLQTPRRTTNSCS